MLVAFLPLGLGCLSRPPPVQGPNVWATGPSQRIRADEPASERTICFDRAGNRVRLAGAVNETLAFQWVLSPRNVPVTGIRLRAEPFTGPGGSIPPGSVRMYRHWPVKVERYANWYLRTVDRGAPREFPDVLVPVDAPSQGQPFTLLPGLNLVIRVEVRVPRGTPPGIYSGAVAAVDSEGQRNRLPVELVVQDIFLDPGEAVPVLAGVQVAPLVAAHTSLDAGNIDLVLREADARTLLQRTFSLLHDHGLSPFTRDVYPRLSQGVDGTVQADWSEFDAICGPWVDGTAYADGLRASAWPLPIDQNQPAPAQYDGAASSFYGNVLKGYLSRCHAHFAEKGWLERAYVDFRGMGADALAPEQAAWLRRIEGIARPLDAKLRILSTLIPQSMSEFGWYGYSWEDLSSAVDIWATPARYQDPALIRRMKEQGKNFWLPPGHPPYSGSLAVEASPIDARSLPWQAFLQGQSAVYVERATDFPAGLPDVPIGDRSQPSDTWLVYPGRAFGLGEPIPSVRLKQLQQGIQDVQYLRILVEHGRAETARLIAGSLIKAGGTDACGDNYQDGLFGRRVVDPHVWDLAHALLVEETALTLRPRPVVPIDLAANRALWAEFLAATRRIEVLPEGVRMALLEEQRESPVSGQSRRQQLFRAQFDVAVRNELRTPVQGSLEFVQPPAGAVTRIDRLPLGPIEESRLVRARLSMELEQLPPLDLDGHYAQRIAFDAKSSGRVEQDALLSAIVVPPVERPIVIDGDLADWPPSESNIAGDFRLINDHPGPGRRRAHAASQTIAYVCQREGVLYVGLHAAAPSGEEASGPSRTSSDVQYEDLQPFGEDLIEILIDPTNAASRSDDLYHLVIKSSGVALFERGIDMQPPIGRAEPWPTAAPAHAVARTDFGWSAELAIPLQTFGVVPRSTVWGFNVARLEPRRGEYSDWARAPRYCYDPRALGNLIWPD